MKFCLFCSSFVDENYFVGELLVEFSGPCCIVEDNPVSLQTDMPSLDIKQQLVP